MQKAVIDARFMAWLYSYNREHRVYFDVLGFLFTCHASPFGRDRQEKDGLD